jgi:lipopolysaccharide/colanic/teichoic acid biosynthesis glycosyltransferase
MYASALKRILDWILVFVSIILVGWLFVLIVLVYVVTFGYPIFFFQERVGRDNKVFQLMKFRSLLNTDKPLEERRFWLGDFLRFFSLDELPQIWNVCKGEMSFIGPRPLPTGYLSLMTEEQQKRHLILPGITGWTQVNGRHSLSWKQKFEFDIYYVAHLSLRLDLLILFKTIVVLLSFRKDRSLAEEKFSGS